MHRRQYHIVDNAGQWQRLHGPEQANQALDLGYNVMVTEPPTPGGRVVVAGSKERF